MVSELDIWRSAQLVIKNHGTRATAEARRRAAELEAKGDVAGSTTWHRIAQAIAALQDDRPGGRVH